MDRKLAWVNAAAAVLFVSCGIWFVHLADEMAAAAVREYGQNVDSGAIICLLVICFVAPNALLTALSALMMFRRWPGRWFVQALAGLCLGATAVIIAIEEMHAF